MKNHVFISYSSKEKEIAYSIKGVLNQNGIRCWMAPDSIEPGSDYMEAIPAGIENCDVFLLLLSDKAQTSPWVRNELSTAMTEGKVVIPFTISKCDISKAFQFALNNAQRLDAYEAMSENLEILVNRIKGIVHVEESNAQTKKIEKISVSAVDKTEKVPASATNKTYTENTVINNSNKTPDWKTIFDYEVKDGTIIIKRFINTSIKDLVIPQMIDGLPVTCIGDKAFKGCKNIKSVIIPEGVTSMGDSVFCECRNLQQISIPKGIIKIEYWAFRGCRSLKKLVFPKGITEIGPGALNYCDLIEQVIIPSSVNFIATDAFAPTGYNLSIGCVRGSYADKFFKRWKAKTYISEDVEYLGDVGLSL